MRRKLSALDGTAPGVAATARGATCKRSGCLSVDTGGPNRWRGKLFNATGAEMVAGKRTTSAGGAWITRWIGSARAIASPRTQVDVCGVWYT